MGEKTTIHVDILTMPKTFCVAPGEESRKTQWHIRTGLSGYALFCGEIPKGLLIGGFQECKKIASALNLSTREHVQSVCFRVQYFGIGPDLEQNWQTTRGRYSCRADADAKKTALQDMMPGVSLRIVTETIHTLAGGEG